MQSNFAGSSVGFWVLGRRVAYCISLSLFVCFQFCPVFIMSSILIAILTTVTFIYDILTYPIYYIVQQPWKKLNASKHPKDAQVWMHLLRLAMHYPFPEQIWDSLNIWKLMILHIKYLDWDKNCLILRTGENGSSWYCWTRK